LDKLWWEKFDKMSFNNPNCTDVSNTVFNKANNCTTISIENFDTFRNIAYALFRLTFGSDLSAKKDMYKIDEDITATFIGFYIAIMGFVYLNIFIALLSSTFSRVYDKAEAYMMFQRANEILKTEILIHTDHLKRYQKFCGLGKRNYSLNQYFRSEKFDPYEHGNY